MKLIKINTDHYVGVDDSEIKEKSGDWFYSFETGKIYDTLIHHTAASCKKITHSTQPLGKPMLFTNAFESDLAISTMGLHDTVIENWGCKKLALQEVKELIGEVDVEKKAHNWFMTEKFMSSHIADMKSFIAGYNQALEDNKEKKYTEKDIDKAYWAGMQFVGEDKGSFGEFIQFLQPKTEWEVEFDENGKLKLV